MVQVRRPRTNTPLPTPPASAPSGGGPVGGLEPVRETLPSEQQMALPADSFIEVLHAPPPQSACSVGHAAGVMLWPAAVPLATVTQRLPDVMPRPGRVIIKLPEYLSRRAAARLPLNVQVTRRVRDVNAACVARQLGPAGTGMGARGAAGSGVGQGEQNLQATQAAGSHARAASGAAGSLVATVTEDRRLPGAEHVPATPPPPVASTLKQ